jgi:hypothetical protein
LGVNPYAASGTTRARGECLSEPGEHRKVSVKLDAGEAAHSQHRQAVMVLQSAELAIDGGAAAVQAAPLVALTRDARAALVLAPAERDDRGPVALGALGVDAGVVLAHVHRERSEREAASAGGVEQRGNVSTA